MAKSLESVTLECEKLKNNLDLVTDKYKRTLAENENLRRRYVKQVEDAKVFGIQSFCKDLLTVADVLNKVHSTHSEVGDQSNINVTDIIDGVRLTESQLLQVFKRHGLEQDCPLNEKFDPNKHEAIFQVPSDDVEPNVIVDVQQVGYILNDRVIRPAKVGVSKQK